MKNVFLSIGILLTAIVFCPITALTFYTPKLFIFSTFTLCGLLYFGFKIKKTKELKLHTSQPMLFAVFFLLIVGLSAIDSSDHNIKVLDYLLWFGFFFLTYFTDHETQIEPSLTILEVTGFLLAGYAFLQHFGYDPVQWHPGGPRVFSSIQNADIFGAVLSSVSMISIVRFLTKPSLMRFLLIEIEGTAIFWSYTRSSLLALFVGIFLLILVSLSNRSWRFPMPRLGFLCLAGLVTFSGLYIASHYTAEKNRLLPTHWKSDNNIQGRRYLFEKGVQVLTDHPWLGTGPGKFSESYLKFRNDEPAFYRRRLALAESTHNTFLDAAVETGLPGALCFLGIWLGCLMVSFRKPVIFMPLLTAFIALQFIYPDITMEALTAYFLGIAAAGTRIKILPLSKRTANIFLLLSVVVVIIGGTFVVWITGADVYAGLGNREMNASDWKNAIKNYTVAVKLNPWNSSYWQKLGLLYERNNKPQGALSTYNEATLLFPGDPGPWANIGRLAGTYHWRKRALTAYAKALALDPYNAPFYHDAAVTAETFRAFPLALHFAREAYQINPEASNAYQFALALANTGKKSEAIQFLIQALKENPSDKDLTSLHQILKHHP